MKYISTYLSGILVVSGLAVSAQTQPKLALAEVSVAPTLAGKLAAPAPAAIPSSENANVLGEWRCEIVGPTWRSHWTVTIKQSADGSLQGLFRNNDLNYSCFSTSIVIEGNRVNMSFYNDKDTNVRVASTNRMDGEVNPDFGMITGTWRWTDRRGKQSAPCSLHRASSTASPALPPVSLADVTHSLNVQLFDRFKGEQFFSVMGGSDLKQTIAATGQPPNPPYDLSKPDTAAQFKQAGINYLLVASVEDFSDQTIEKRRTKDFHFQTGLYFGTRAYDARFGRNGISSATTVTRAGMATQGGFDPEVWQQQTIRLTVRCQLFDAATGELKKSTTGTFPFQRDYSAVAQGANQLSTADLCEAAARNVAAWATILVDDAIFPIKVLAKNDQEITISRGAEAGLQTSQVFDVCTQGEVMKDPDTGKVLGNDIKIVGRVVIAKLEPKFSHAKVLEDKGIVPGATLMRAAY